MGIKNILNRVIYSNQGVSQFMMGLLSILVGVVAGFGAVILRAMIGFVHNLVFFNRLDIFYDANIHTAASSYGWLVIFVPVVGAIIVAWLVKTFAPEARGHGVPEVMDAIHFNDGKIRPIVAVIKSIASAVSIGTGGSVGREGPIVQIGSAFGSVRSKIISMPTRQRVILVAAGAAGGIAASFNTPIGGLAFGIELILVTVSASSLFSVALATVTATYIGRAFLGVTPSFYIPALMIPDFHLMPLGVLIVFIPFGILIGLLSVAFIYSVYWAEDVFNAIPGNYYTRHMLGMLCVGLLMYAMMTWTGDYYIQGVGYATIVDILRGILNHPLFLLFLVVMKMLATSLTLGSGASGGIFSPSLFLGAAFGSAFGCIMQYFFPGLGVDPIIFALAGMAGMIGGATGAVITAMVMVTEMTHDNNVILPIMVTVTVAYAVRKVISNESIYTMKLFRRGDILPEGLHSTRALVQRAQQVMNKDFKVISLDEFEANLSLFLDNKLENMYVVIEHDNKILGLLNCYEKESGPFDYRHYIDHRFHLYPMHTKLITIMKEMEQHREKYMIITHDHNKTNAENIIGIITDREIRKSHHQLISVI